MYSATMDSATPRWGHDQRHLLTLDEAWTTIASEARRAAPQSVDLADAAGLTLARPVVAGSDWPPFDKAMMDGFAVRSDDCATSGATLGIAGLAAAGDATDQTLGPGQAMRINTGAPMPNDADAVVRIEDTGVSDDGATVTINVNVPPKKHVARRGANRRVGDLLLAAPMLIEAHQMAALATAGCARVSVYPRTEAAIVLTGNEIVPVGQSLAPGQIHDSNGPMLASLIRQFGGTPRRVGIVGDEASALREKLADALRSPVVITVGGMSMGTLDLVPKAFTDLGVEWRFHGVSMRPGKPFAYGRGPDGQHVFGLPGNPVSAFVCAWLFVRMTLRALMGHPCKPPHRLRATLTRMIEPKRDPRPAFLPGRFWNHSEAGEIVEPCAWGGSGDPFGLAMANCLIAIDDPTRGAALNESIEVIPITTDL
ncbi:MAG: molybdopterin molybdotransferase MoeA [Phycisphaerales bacterium]|nr:molybdopterin molybdotransferase MoeA [Phycisphaerales bacterium]